MHRLSGGAAGLALLGEEPTSGKTAPRSLLLVGQPPGHFLRLGQRQRQGVVVRPQPRCFTSAATPTSARGFRSARGSLVADVDSRSLAAPETALETLVSKKGFKMTRVRSLFQPVGMY